MPDRLYTKKEYQSVLLRKLGNSQRLRIIDFFLDNPLFDFTKKEVFEALGMSKQTFYKYFPDIEKEGVVEVTRRIGRAKLYRINPRNSLARELRQFVTRTSLETAREATQRRRPLVERAA